MIVSDALAAPGIRHGFFTRNGGVSEGIYESLNIGLGSQDTRAHVLENRSRIAGELGVVPNRLVSPYQKHTSVALTVSGPWQDGSDRTADALVTREPGLALGISTADCGPVLFCDSKAGVIGAAHSGWKGAFGGILENTIAAMEELGADRANITATLGPTISQDSYEVGPEFRQRFVDTSEENAVYFKPSNKAGHAMFDLPGYIVSRLKAAGCGSVENLALCTYQDEARFFSYRRTTHRQEPDYGRLMSAIVIEAG
ncbi:peptidoglycan editing factor PgeF [Roseibium sp. RKSG952]|uniref:peptidoglycan editing factor PgeF n=1 Tax=Roseibium sp. RKSG952 TaxID=2529384 RepID=UPI0012BD54E7|nr:peptidoglycan editing factor PgeF [Roseibium sp. RKSG952]MTH98163.1 peptidoglycan editing factor PgeF [Roseibium sp. RKSG952]